MSSRFILSLALAAAAGAVITAVGADVRGRVTDPARQPLADATVRLLLPDSAYVDAAVTDEQGRYRLAGVHPGSYILQAEYTGYAPSGRSITVGDGDTLVRVKPLMLDERSHMLDEVSVTAVKTQIKVKEDTVEFNADSYQTRPNAVVEDLIKRLPGVEVGSDGKITANGRQVSKILLDGKEFFGDDPTVASKNIPVDIVDKLQVIDRKSDLARLTGVDDGEEETVINLSVKKGRNNGWFGNAEGGYGTDDRYTGQFTVNRFSNGNQITLLFNANNINQSGFADGNAGRFSRFGSSGGINDTQSVGLNFNVGKEEIIRVGGNILYGHTDRLSIEELTREYLAGTDSPLSRSGSRNDQRSHNLRGDFRVLWQPDSFNTLEVRPSFSFNKINTERTDSTLFFSTGLAPLSRSYTSDTSDGHSLEGAIRLIYTHKFNSRRGRSFSVNATYSHSDTRQDADSYALSEFYGSDEPDENSDQTEDNHTWTNAINGRLSWTEPIGNLSGGNFITVAYRANYRWNNADKETCVLDPATGSYSFSPLLSNIYTNRYFNQDIRLGYKKTTRTLSLDAGLSLVPQSSSSSDLIDGTRSIPTRSTFNVAPYLWMRWRRGKNRSLNLRYMGRASQPSLSYLQPVADTSDPMNITVGNPELDPSFRHDIRLRFQDYNAEHQRSVMAMLFGSAEQNSVVSITEIDKGTGARTTSYRNVNGVWSARLMSMYSQPLGASKMWLMSAHLMLGYNHNIGFNNAQRNTSGLYDLNIAPSIALRPANIDLELRPFYRLQHTSNTLPAIGDMTVHSYGGNFNGSWYTPWHIVLTTELTYTATSGYSAGYDESTWLWNASIGYQFLRDRSATVSLKGYDLLGQTSSVSRNVTANYIDDSRTNTLTRYFMVTLAWSFNTFGKGKEPQMMDMPGMHRHGPPPPRR